jgi:hypothetical protein
MLHQGRGADYVLAIASIAYRRRAEDTATTDEGREVLSEAALIRPLQPGSAIRSEGGADAGTVAGTE